MCPCDCWLQQVAGALFLDSSVKEALFVTFVCRHCRNVSVHCLITKSYSV